MTKIFYVCLFFVFIGCTVDREETYAYGDYYFKYIDNKSVSFCGLMPESKKSYSTLYVPETIYGLNVVRIGKGSRYYNFSGVHSIILHSGIKSIGEETFCREKLKKIVFSEGLEVIEKKAFKDCNLEKNLTLPEGLKAIGEKAFDSCHELEKISLPASLKTLEKRAFESCIKLKDVSFPDTANWYVKRDNDPSWYPIDVSNPSVNAKNLSQTYKDYIWEKRP